MGYYAIPFAANIQKLRAILGSKDPGILEKATNAPLYNHYAFDDEGKDLGFDAIIYDLVFNYVKPVNRKPQKRFFGLFSKPATTGLNDEKSHLYGYAMLVLCDTIGQLISPPDEFYAHSNWDDIDSWLKAHGISIRLNQMWESNNPFDLPEIADFPVINYYPRDQIFYALKGLKEINFQIDEENDNEIHAELNIFVKLLQYCADRDTDLVTFLH